MSTSLMNRPVRSSRSAQEPGRRPLTTSALMAGAGAALTTLLLSMAVALAGWFLADNGAHGETTDALRAGSVAWLLGHGSPLVLDGVPLGMLPLGLTLLLLVAGFRGGRWAAHTSSAAADLRVLGSGLATFVVGYVVVVVGTCVLASQAGATPVLGRALLGAVLVSGVSGALGLAVGSRWLGEALLRLPDWVRVVAYGALAGALGVVMAAAALVAGSLLFHLNDAATIISELHLSAGDALMFTLVTALVAPNLVLLGAAYLVGPGFAVGTGTTVSTSSVALGPLPAFPALAALPAEGTPPGWAVGFLALPPAIAAVAAARAQSRTTARAYDYAALRGAGMGLGAGVLVSLLVALAGGPLGTGRMADIGAPFSEVLVIAAGGMALAGVVGSLAMTWWQRRSVGDG